MSDQYLDLFANNIAELKSKDFKITQTDKDIWKISPRIITAKSIAFVAITHGEEVVGLHILNEILFRLLENKLQLKGDLYLILGNREAYLKNQRYIKADLNRAYHIEGKSDKYEEQRALSIKKTIQNCAYVLDFHQSVEDTLFPFFILPYNDKPYDWVSYIGPNIPIIEKNALQKITTLSNYVHSIGKYGVTLEVGGSGFDAYQIALGTKVAENIINSADQENFYTSSNRDKASLYTIDYHEDYDVGEVQFIKKFINFETVEKDQIIALKDNKEVKTPIAGQILLYPQVWFKKDSPTAPEGIFAIINNKNPI